MADALRAVEDALAVLAAQAASVQRVVRGTVVHKLVAPRGYEDADVAVCREDLLCILAYVLGLVDDGRPPAAATV
jgi:hypothetical protein